MRGMPQNGQKNTAVLYDHFMSSNAKDRWRVMFEVRGPRKLPRKKPRKKVPKPTTKDEENLAEFTRTEQALEMMVSNCLSHTPVRNGYTYLDQWMADNRTVKFHGPRRSGKTTAAVNLARRLSFCPMFVAPDSRQKTRLESNFSLRNVCTFDRVNLEIRDLNPDWVVIEDPFERFSADMLREVYRGGAPGLQLVILVT